MSDKMQPIEFQKLLKWAFSEYAASKTVFGIPQTKFHYRKNKPAVSIFNEPLETPLGPAAGPHTQLTQNILSAYLTGGSFFELKTVQKLDRLEIDKPCIDAGDEGYNVEWSQELTLDQSYEEYMKAWFLLHLVKEVFGLSKHAERGFIFNMSVGYDLAGIQTPRMDRFIDELKDAWKSNLFEQYRTILRKELTRGYLSDLLLTNPEIFRITRKRLEEINERMEAVSPLISGSVTLSTMHGCPPQEIESISRYLIREKGLHTYVKLNPTLLGYERVKDMLHSLGYRYMDLDRAAFEHDLQYADAVPMLQRLQEFADGHGKTFGVKLSNTLGMNNNRGKLAGDQMYMSGRALFPLTIALAGKLASQFGGNLNISYSGGVSAHNVTDILANGIYPVTLATDLLKPGGYTRLFQMAQAIEKEKLLFDKSNRIDIGRLKKLAESAPADIYYHKEKREIDSIKIPARLTKFDCYLSPCSEACPIHQDVAEYVRLVEEGRFSDAFEVIISKNPLPHITGHICDHQCMNHCTRWDYDDPVQIRDQKKEAAQRGFEDYLEKFRAQHSMKNNGVKTAIIGAGPAGLAAAYFLAKSGFNVTIFEQTDKAGGTVQHVIPGFRLPQTAIDKDVEFIKRHGVRFVFNSQPDFSVAKLRAEGYKYTFLGIGAPESNRLPLQGESKNVYDAIDFLKAFNKNEAPALGKCVAVIGGGNSAMDGARAAMRSPGVEKVYIIYRRTREWMPADREEFDAALADGIIFRELLLPVTFESGGLKCQKMQLGGMGADGRRQVSAVKDSFETIAVDSIISAIGEHADTRLLQKNELLSGDRQKLQVMETTNETILENVFIGGDALRGPSTVVESIADGKKAAEAIIQREGLTQESPENRLSKLFDHSKRMQDTEIRKGTILPGQPDSPAAEAERCLACNLVCNKCVEVCPNRANIPIAVSGPDVKFRDAFQILHVDGMCNECGNCETFCPYAGSPYKEKITLFWNEQDFADSTNDGFYLMQRQAEGSLEFRVRFNKQEGSLRYNAAGERPESALGEKNSSPDMNRFLEMIKTVARDYAYLL
ncbi:MAG: putative selenate reductase subunit YgfK [Calditrichia bacterium]